MNSSPLEKFYQWEKTKPDSIFLRQPIDGHWNEYSYSTAGREIRSIAAGLKAMNLPEGSNIAILSKNCAHWIMADLAIWMAGHVTVPVYPTLSASGIRYVLEHSETKAIFIGKLDEYGKQRDGIPESINKISFPFYGPREGQLWNELIQLDPIKESPLQYPESLATIVYSSGTTGIPKGVMLNVKALDFFSRSLLKNLNVQMGSRFFSYLPLAHIADRASSEMGVLYSGGNISFSESLEKFAKNLGEVKPNIFLGVPRIYAKIQEGVLSKISQKKLDTLLSIPIISSLLKKFIKKKIGLINANIIACGAAPLPVSLYQWYERLGISIQDIYGMTENCAYSHGAKGERYKYGTVGKAWPEVEVKLGEENEILVKHDGMMKGYFKDPETTKNVFTPDGFLKTGDQGSIDTDGFLTLTGRLKDQFKTDKGKFISPAAIEMKLISNQDIEQVCVVGSGVPQPIALVTLSIAGRAKSKNEIIQTLSLSLEQVNPTLESFERLEKVVIMKQEWTVENGLMTPTLKVKRNEVEKVHLPMYPKWYKEDGTVVWE